LGVSDRHYFAWLAGALERFERDSGELCATGAGRPVDLWVLAGARTNPAIELARDALGRSRTAVRWLDRFERGPEVVPADFNALGEIAGDACDVLMMTRASYMIEDPAAFLGEARRLLRPGGLLVIDWLHGSAETPALDLPGHHEYDGRRYPFRTTYCDAESLTDFAAEFGALIRHANRPTLRQRLRHPLGGTAPDPLTTATYLPTLRDRLARAGKHLVEPAALQPAFKVLFRDARYLYPVTKKHYLYLLTVLRPVGK
jgi:SAM-dependent methyltransferase